MRYWSTIIVFVVIILASLTTLRAQDLSGYWQGVSYVPDSNYGLYWPLSLTLSQNNNSLTGQCLEINGAKPQYYSLWEVTNGSVQNNAGTFDLIKSKQQTREYLTYWCTGTINFTYYPTDEKIIGVADYNNCPEKGYFELYRLVLKSPRAFCKGQPINLLITGKNVKWYSDKEQKKLVNQGNTFVPNLAQTTTFYVTQTNYNTESPAVPITIEINDLAILKTTVADATCGNSNGVISLTATASSAIQYNVNNGLFQDSPVFQHLSSGLYTVSIKDQSNCQATKQLTINQQPAPYLTATTSNRTCSEEGVISLQGAAGLLPYQYSLDSVHFQPNNQFKVNPNVYRVYLRDANNCLVGNTVTIKNECLSTLFAPDAFTPNGDGHNDTFVLIKPFYQTTLLIIYNRWGEVLLRTNKAEWDGFFNGFLCPEGVYMWQVELSEVGGANLGTRTGRVVLLR